MGRRQTGLFKRGRVFYIDKIIKGYGRLRESTGAGDRRDAEDYLARRLAEIGHYVSQGIRLDRTFKEAAAKYLIEMSHIRTINEAAIIVDWLVAEIGEVCLVEIGPALIDQLIAKRQGMENANATVNRHMGKLRAILKKAVEWQWIVALGVPLNNDAMVILRGEQGRHPRWVFTYEGERVIRCNNHAWRKALRRAGIENF